MKRVILNMVGKLKTIEKIVEKPVEVRVEVPVEKIVEKVKVVEKIVPVRIQKEVVVEKIVPQPVDMNEVRRIIKNELANQPKPEYGPDYQFNKGEVRFKQPDGKWSPWQRLTSGSGGITQAQVQTQAYCLASGLSDHFQ